MHIEDLKLLRNHLDALLDSGHPLADRVTLQVSKGRRKASVCVGCGGSSCAPDCPIVGLGQIRPRVQRSIDFVDNLAGIQDDVELTISTLEGGATSVRVVHEPTGVQQLGSATGAAEAIALAQTLRGYVIDEAIAVMAQRREAAEGE